jgi:hypothetical protein
MLNLWPKWWQICDHSYDKPWQFHFKVWRWHIVSCDDLNTYSMTIPKRGHQLPRHCWRHHHVSCHIIGDVTATSTVSVAAGWPKYRNICDKIGSSHNTNTGNNAVSTHGRWEIMTKTGFHPWPTTFVMDWIQFHDVTQFVTEWRHIRDENYHFIVDDQMWREHSDEIQIVTNSSQMNISDDTGVFSDVRWMSSMPTSLLVCTDVSLDDESEYLMCIVANEFSHLFMYILLLGESFNICYGGTSNFESWPLEKLHCTSKLLYGTCFLFINYYGISLWLTWQELEIHALVTFDFLPSQSIHHILCTLLTIHINLEHVAASRKI